MTDSPDFDIGIIGGGPAGAAMGGYLAKAGIKCVILESELFPREHVGESLVPSSTRVFKDLDFLTTMEEAKFPHKFGAVWTSATSKSTVQHDWEGLQSGNAEIRFSERAQPGVDKEYTYHVDRGRFDNLLLQHAKKLGATVYEGISVSEVDFSPKLPEIKFKMGQQTHSIKVRMVVDASGRRTLLGNQLKMKIKDPVFDQCAFHTWFEGYNRHAAVETEEFGDYIFVHFLPISNSWVWQIPITETITSLGVVCQRKNFPKTKAQRETFFWECVSTRPELYKSLKEAKQLRPFKEEGDYSYSMTQLAGDRFMLIGDAGRFVDPIFSTGVSIALNCARFGSQDIINAVKTGNFSRESFSNFEKTIRQGTRTWYEFISVYYRLNVLFTYFVGSKEHRLDVLKLLQGDVYEEEEPPVLKKMRETVRVVEQDKNHIWHKLLGDLTSGDYIPKA